MVETSILAALFDLTISFLHLVMCGINLTIIIRHYRNGLLG